MKKIRTAAGCLLVLALGTGCGSSGTEASSKVASLSTPGPASSPAAVQDSAERGKAFAQCLRDNGLKVSDPDPKTGQIDRNSVQDADRSKLQKALDACRDKMPQQDGEMEKLRNPDAETKAKMVEFAQCMRDAGQDFPDPGPNGFDFSKLNSDDESLRKAAEECQKTHPFADFGGGQ